MALLITCGQEGAVVVGAAEEQQNCTVPSDDLLAHGYSKVNMREVNGRST